MGCNTSKGGISANASNKDGWGIPLVRSLSRSWSMPYQANSSSKSTSASDSFHVVALTSSTYGVLDSKNSSSSNKSRFSQEFQCDEDEEDDPGEVVNPSPSFIKLGSDQKSSDRVRVPEVMDVWELVEDSNDTTNKPCMKRRKRARTYAKSASLSHIPAVYTKSDQFELVHGLPLVLEENPPCNSSVVWKNSAEKLKNRSRPPLAPASSIRKGLFYGATIDQSSKQGDDDPIASKCGGQICAAMQEVHDTGSSRRSSGYYTPQEQFASDNSGPPSPPNSALDDEGWYLVGGRKLGWNLSLKDEKIFGGGMKGGCLRDKTNIATIASSNNRIISSSSSLVASLLDGFERKCPPGGEDRVVFYFTSLQGIRKTYEQCRNVKMILEGLFARIDERDVSMHAEFRQELRGLLGSVGVPRLFIKGRYIGGAEEVMQLNENGLIRQLLEGIPKERRKKSCEGCGGMRFIPCMECSGSCKVVGDDDQVVRCWDCNENGLVRCPICC